MKKWSFIVKLSICIVVFALIVSVIIGLFTTGTGKKTMMTNEELTWQKNRLITLSVFAGVLIIGIITFGTLLIFQRKKVYESISNEDLIEVDDE